MDLSGWKEKLFRLFLGYSCNRFRVDRYLKSILPAQTERRVYQKDRLRVSALQVELRLFKDPLEYISSMHRLLKEAVADEACMVVFPEYNNLSLLGMLPGIEEALGESDNNNEKPGLNGITLADIFTFLNPVFQPLVHRIYARFASAYRLYIMAGSYIISDDNKTVVNRAFLFSPDGHLIGTQDKVNLMPMEEELGFKRGEEIKVFHTEAGRIGMPVCMDATYYETFRTLELKKAEIVLLPIANMEDYNYWLAMRGIWPRVQESLLYGVKSALVGSIGRYKFTGKAGIYAPMELTPHGDGIIAEAVTYDQETVVTADLDLQKLSHLRLRHPWKDRNLELYNCYFPQIYR